MSVEPIQCSYGEFRNLSFDEKYNSNKIFLITDTPSTDSSLPNSDYSDTKKYLAYDSSPISTAICTTRHRRIYRRKESHCPYCGGVLPAIEYTDSTELKCSYCDSMVDAMEIIDEEY